MSEWGLRHVSVKSTRCAALSNQPPTRPHRCGVWLTRRRPGRSIGAAEAAEQLGEFLDGGLGGASEIASAGLRSIHASLLSSGSEGAAAAAAGASGAGAKRKRSEAKKQKKDKKQKKEKKLKKEKKKGKKHKKEK